MKNTEVERRELGKKMAEMKRQQEEQERIEAAKERRKDKEEEKLARERVRSLSRVYRLHDLKHDF